MDQNLESLPKSDSDFWKHAEINQHTLKENKHVHKFERVSVFEFECRCGAGIMARGLTAEKFAASL